MFEIWVFQMHLLYLRQRRLANGVTFYPGHPLARKANFAENFVEKDWAPKALRNQLVMTTQALGIQSKEFILKQTHIFKSLF